MTAAALVVGNSFTPTGSDIVVSGLLTDLGVAVTFIDDNAAAPTGYDLIVVAESCDSAAVATKFINKPTPVVVFEPVIADDMGLTSSAPAALSGNGVDVIGSHPIVPKGWSGNRTIYDPTPGFPTGNQNLYSVPISSLAPGVTSAIRSDVAAVGQASLLTLEAGGAAATWTAQARVVYFGALTGAFEGLNANGRTLFKRMFTWALGWKYLSFQGRDTYQDGVIINQGSDAEGLIMNARLVQATVDHDEQAPNWNPESNTNNFVAELPAMAAHGLNAITINCQGGLYRRSAQEAYDAGAFNANGTLRTDHASRILRAVTGMLDNGIIPVVGIFYFRQDQILTNASALQAAIDNLTALLADHQPYVMLEVINEATHGLIDHPQLDEANVHNFVDALVAGGWIATHSQVPGQVPTVAEQGDGQIVFLHGNNKTIAELNTMVTNAKNAHPNKPIMFNEDGPSVNDPGIYTAAEYVARLNAMVTAGVGWGYYDQSGFQEACNDANSGAWQCSNPATNATGINWDVDHTAVSTAVFDRWAVLTESEGGEPPPSGGQPVHSSAISAFGVNTATYSHSFDLGTGANRVVLVKLSWGASASGINDSTPTINGVNLVRVGSRIDARSVTNRRMSVWKYPTNAPPSGSATVAGTFSAVVAGYSVSVVVVADADDVDPDTVVVANAQVGTGAQATVTTDHSPALVYLFAVSGAATLNPYTPQAGTTEVLDETQTNHTYFVGHRSGTGPTIQVGATGSGSGDFGWLALEVYGSTTGGTSPTRTHTADAVVATSGGGGGVGVWVEANRRVVFEIESTAATGDWQFQSSDAGFTGTGYFTQTGAPSMAQGGQSILTYNFRIVNGGQYFVTTHSRRQGTGASDANNDVWFRFDNGTWFKHFQRAGLGGTTPAGSTASHEVWRWMDRYEHHTLGNIDPVFTFTAGDHTIQFSKRSDNISIDRVHMFSVASGTPTFASNPALSTPVSTFDSGGGGGLTTEQRAFTTDVIIRSAGTHSHTTDVLLGSAGTATHTTDVRIAGEFVGSGLTATAVSPTQINLSWDAVTEADEYDLERNGTIVIRTAQTSYEDTGLTPNTTYTYRVRPVRF